MTLSVKAVVLGCIAIFLAGLCGELHRYFMAVAFMVIGLIAIIGAGMASETSKCEDDDDE